MSVIEVPGLTKRFGRVVVSLLADRTTVRRDVS
jgi:hypothetical protein